VWLSSCSSVGSPINVVILLWEHGWVYHDYDDSALIFFFPSNHFFNGQHVCLFIVPLNLCSFCIPWVQIPGSLSQKASLCWYSQKNVTVMQQNIDLTKPLYDDTIKQWYGWLVWQKQDTLYIQKISSNLKLVTCINMYINPLYIAHPSLYLAFM